MHRRGEIVTILTVGAFVALFISTIVGSLVTKKSQPSLKSRAGTIAAYCPPSTPDDPGFPYGGCSRLTVTDYYYCKTNDKWGYGEWRPDTENKCYGLINCTADGFVEINKTNFPTLPDEKEMDCCSGKNSVDSYGKCKPKGETAPAPPVATATPAQTCLPDSSWCGYSGKKGLCNGVCYYCFTSGVQPSVWADGCTITAPTATTAPTVPPQSTCASEQAECCWDRQEQINYCDGGFVCYTANNLLRCTKQPTPTYAFPTQTPTPIPTETPVPTATPEPTIICGKYKTICCRDNILKYSYCEGALACINNICELPPSPTSTPIPIATLAPTPTNIPSSTVTLAPTITPKPTNTPTPTPIPSPTIPYCGQGISCPSGNWYCNGEYIDLQLILFCYLSYICNY